MIGILVTGHGNFATGISSSVKLIAGMPEKYEMVDFLESYSVDDLTRELNAAMDRLSDCDGILVPGGFGERGTYGKMLAIKYARINKVPLLGICYGMHLACIEYARDVLGYLDANTTEIDPNTTHPIIDYLPGQYEGINLGGTLRLGLYDCKLNKDTKTYHYYQKELIKERHRHRYEVNNNFLEVFNKDLVISGINPQTNLVEIVELKNHPYFICCQFHPEFLSRPNRAHPLFIGLIENAIKTHISE